MSNTTPKMGERARIRSALERIETLETEVPRIVAGVNNGFVNVEQRLNENTEIMNAIAELVGQDSVAAKVAENRLKRAEAAAQMQADGLAKALVDGHVTMVTTIGEKTIIVGKSFDKDGNIEPPGRVQMDYGKVKPEFKEQFLGKPVGTIIDTPTGGKLEVTELYEIVPPAPPAENTDAPAPVAAAAVAADATPTQPSAQA
jgi:hypothetical protein